MADSVKQPPAGVAKALVLSSRGSFPPYAVAACCLVFFWSISIRALIYTVMPAAGDQLHLSTAAAGIVIAAMLFGYCIGSWAAGWLPGSRKRRILGGMLLSFPGVVSISMAGDPWLLFSGALMVGLGVGVYLPLGLALIVEAGSKAGMAFYMALHEVAATLGTFGGSAFLAVGLTWTTWRGSLLAWLPVGLLALLVFAAVKDERGEAVRRTRSLSPLLDRATVYGSIAYAVATMLVVGLISVLPLIMVRAWGLDQASAASAVGYTRLAGLVGVAIAGFGADRLGSLRVVLGLQALGLIGAIAMSLNGFGPLFLVGIVVLAAGASGNITLLPVVIAAPHAPEERERALAMAAGVGGFLGLAASPALFGLLVDAGLVTGPIWVASVATLVSIVVTGRLRGG